MCKYEMDQMSIVENTEQTSFCPPTDRRTDGQGETSITRCWKPVAVLVIGMMLMWYHSNETQQLLQVKYDLQGLISQYLFCGIFRTSHKTVLTCNRKRIHRIKKINSLQLIWRLGISRFRHMRTSSNGNIFHLTGPLCGEFTGEFPSQRPVAQSFDVFFDLHT